MVAIDLRGHGRSKLPANPRKMKSWNKFRDDVIQVLEKTAPDGAVLGGHSMGATVALLVAGKRPDLVRGLVLTDPVLLKKRMTRIYNIPLVNMLVGMIFMTPAQKLAEMREFAPAATMTDWHLIKAGQRAQIIKTG